MSIISECFAREAFRIIPYPMQAAGRFIVEPVGLAIESLSRPIDFRVLYGNDHPVELEIGMGKGTFLCDQACARPEINFFGIEWANWFARYAADRMRRHGCKNAHTVRADAKFFIKEFVPDHSIDVLHIYFPDPWPKNRHQKRRMVQDSFLPEIHRILKIGGKISIVTDHKGYWEEDIEPTIKKSGLKISEYTRPNSAKEGEFVGTNFERKYIREGRPFYAIAAIKEG